MTQFALILGQFTHISTLDSHSGIVYTLLIGHLHITLQLPCHRNIVNSGRETLYFLSIYHTEKKKESKFCSENIVEDELVSIDYMPTYLSSKNASP